MTGLSPYHPLQQPAFIGRLRPPGAFYLSFRAIGEESLDNRWAQPIPLCQGKVPLPLTFLYPLSPCLPRLREGDRPQAVVGGLRIDSGR